MRLYELFSKTFPYKWIARTSNHWQALFNVNETEYSASMSYDENFIDPITREPVGYWDMSFTPSENGLAGSTVTGIGNEFLIFSTVLKIFDEFVSNVHPPMISVSCTKKQPKRFILYSKIANRFGSYLTNHGYEKSECPIYKYTINLSDYETMCWKKIT